MDSTHIITLNISLFLEKNYFSKQTYSFERIEEKNILVFTFDIIKSANTM